MAELIGYRDMLLAQRGQRKNSQCCTSLLPCVDNNYNIPTPHSNTRRKIQSRGRGPDDREGYFFRDTAAGKRNGWRSRG